MTVSVEMAPVFSSSGSKISSGKLGFMAWRLPQRSYAGRRRKAQATSMNHLIQKSIQLKLTKIGIFAPLPLYHRSTCEFSRMGFAVKGIVASGVSVMGSSLAAEPTRGVERLPYKPEGYNYWTWRGHKIHYVVQGEGSPVVLIHGFGASAFHWRYNTPELARKHKVYAIDLLGFGWSDKALIEYDAMVWRDQVVDFLKEIVKEPTVLVGNR